MGFAPPPDVRLSTSYSWPEPRLETPISLAMSPYGLRRAQQAIEFSAQPGWAAYFWRLGLLPDHGLGRPAFSFSPSGSSCLEGQAGRLSSGLPGGNGAPQVATGAHGIQRAREGCCRANGVKESAKGGRPACPAKFAERRGKPWRVLPWAHARRPALRKKIAP